jgi:hypothetical protein
MFFSVSANNIIYSVTFVPCVPGSTCPQGNPSFFNQTFALNGTISPNLTLNVGDRLEFDLATNVSIHPLTICQNSPVPNFCKGAANSNLLNTPITLAGTSTAVNFTTAGTYYYGCQNHPGMGATITVVQTSTGSTGATIPIVQTSNGSTSATITVVQTSTGGNGARHQLSASFLFIAVIPLLAIIFI